MHCSIRFAVYFLFLFPFSQSYSQQSWIRINQLGYTPDGTKVAVWCSKTESVNTNWSLVDANSKRAVYIGKIDQFSGPYGPFMQTARLNFSLYKKPGKYYLMAGDIYSPEFEIGENVYNGAADFCLRYMREQRSKFNPVIKDSCHTLDGYTLYGPMPDSSFIDVSGGWHDATDYLQYATTSANTTFHLLAAYRDFPAAFADMHQSNGLEGSNNIPDILDEARWGLDWLLKMHPNDNWMFNQIGDDRDHMGMRMPGLDSQYGKGFQRPVYFVSGDPQIRGKFKNATKGTSSTAGKFSSAFSLGSFLFKTLDNSYAEKLKERSVSAFMYGLKKPGTTQTASVVTPYIYAEDNWMDDMELAAAMLGEKKNIDYAYSLAQQEPLTPWLGTDTANHYQWYPFINVGHYELIKKLYGKRRDTVAAYYKRGIDLVWNKAKHNAFFRGVPFIWCSNNLTASFAIQCYWYRKTTGDKQFEELEQANVDWLFGCNPWGTSMVYGLPAWGDTPADPHASLLKVGNYPIDGGIVDGPVYGSIYSNLIGITLTKPDEYAPFQSRLAVYHDDSGDYSTNEPTMDGTASLIYLLASREAHQKEKKTFVKPVGSKKKPAISRNFVYHQGGIIRGDSSIKKIALVFTGDEFAEGGDFIRKALGDQHVKSSFFLTGNFYRNNAFKKLITGFKKDGHYLGPHSDKHLLYCDWNKRDSLLVTKDLFNIDLQQNYAEMKKFGITEKDALYFMPPYEWYNDSITAWANEKGIQLINFTPGTLSNADYTTPGMKNYRSSDAIMSSLLQYEQLHNAGFNGFILLLHMGTDSSRTDKMYRRLPALITHLKKNKYRFVRIDELLR